MNYLVETNKFYDYLVYNSLTTSEIALWHALMHINNHVMWKTGFTASNRILQQLTGLSIPGLATAKNKLKQRGLIDYIPGKAGQSGKFRMMSFYVKEIEEEEAEEPGEDSHKRSEQNALRDERTIINRNKDINTNENREEAEEVRAPGIPYQKIVNLYNDLCPKMNRCMKVSDARERAVKARYSSGYALEDFEKLFRLAGESRFLNGGNERNWRADFDWLVRDANMAKVLEGKYADDRPPSPEPDGTDAKTDWGLKDVIRC